MSKRLLILIFTIFLGFIISFSTNTIYASEVESAVVESYSEEYFSNVNQSVEFREQVLNPYIVGNAEYNGKEFTVYSDDFAGVYIDNQGILNIAVISGLQQTSLYGEQVLYKQVTFSYNYLQKVMNAVEDMMDFSSIIAVGIDDMLNHVFVEMNDEGDMNQIIEHLQRDNLYESEAIIFEVDANAKVSQDANTVYGGESISGGGFRGTAGVNARCNITGRLGIITNEHVAPLGIAMNYRGHFNTTTNTFSRNIALGDPLRAQNGGTVDASFIPFTNQEDWAVTPYGRYNTTSYTNVMLGTENQITRGQPVMRVGQTTGVTTGEIRSTNVAVTVDGIRKTNTFRYTNDGQGGDSGGPVYFNDGTNLHLLGLHFASSDVFLGGRQGIACRILNVAAALDVTIITNDSFNTTNLSSGGIELNQVNFNTTGPFVIPSQIGGRNVTSIGTNVFSNQNEITRVEIPTTVTDIKSSAFVNRTSITEVVFERTSNVQTIGNMAFSGCNGLSQIHIPSSVTHIGNDAFKNTNNAPIYLQGRTKAPSTFNINWNSSVNPVYLNGNLCSHTSSVTTISLDDTHHGNLCNDCRTVFSKSLHSKYVSNGWEYCYGCSYSKQVSSHTHNFTGSYINMGNLHRQYCACGDYRERPHIGVPNNPGDRYVLCWDCNELIDTWYYMIMIPFRVGINLEDYDCDDCHHHDHEYEIIMINQESDFYLDRRKDYYVDLNKRERDFIF